MHSNNMQLLSVLIKDSRLVIMNADLTALANNILSCDKCSLKKDIQCALHHYIITQR